jgi:hypothetical protein
LGLTLFGLSSLVALAQETRGQILGRVVDPSGAVVVGATVKALNTATGVETSTVTNESGDYMLSYLIPGTYSITVTAPGFKSSVHKDIQVRVADRITINISLEVGQATDTIVVTGETPLVEAASASLGQVVDRRRIVDLPLKDGNPNMLAFLAPGVTNLSTGGWTRPFDVNSPSAMAVNGTRTGTNEFTIDGGPNSQRGKVAYIPPTEAVQEFKIQTATFDASLGYTLGAVVNVSLKSGTNELHGATWDFGQNTALNATDFFRKKNGQGKLPVNLQRWGASVGGPLWLGKLYNGKNKTFWMYSYEGIHDAGIESPGSGSVPTAPEKQGDFSALLALGSQYQIYDPATTTPAPNGRFTRQPFPGNIIPPARLNAAAVKMVGFYDLPNQVGAADGSNNWYTSDPERDTFYSHVFRADQNLSEKHHLFVRGQVNSRIQNYRNHNGGDGYSYTAPGADGQLEYRQNRGFGADYVYVFSPGFLMNLRYSYTRFIGGDDPVKARAYNVTSLGFSSQFADQINQIDLRGMKFPNINPAGYNALSEETWSFNYYNVHDLAADFTKVIRGHNIRFGTGFRAYQINNYDLDQSAGSFSFGDYVNGPFDNSPSAPMGQGLAGLLLGLPGGSIPVKPSYAEETKNWVAFLQDDWKVTSKLTINLGLRYELEIPTTERYNRTVLSFDAVTPSPLQSAAQAAYALNPVPQVPVSQFKVLGGLTFAGVNGNSRGLWQTDTNNFAPRLGLAYQLGSKTVIRGGYGMFYDQLGVVRRNVNQPGYSSTTSVVISEDNGQHFITNLTNPFPSGIVWPSGAKGGLMTYTGQSISFFNTKLTTPYMHRWQVGIQQQLPDQMIVEVAYVGNLGRDLRASRQLDPIPRQYLSTSPVRDNATINLLTSQVPNPFYGLLPKTSLAGSTVSLSQLLRPYPQFTGISWETNEGYSWYQSLQTRFEKRMSQGVTIGASWTWSKFMEATGFLNETDASPERVISDQDRRHRLVITGLWELPVGPGKKWGSSLHGVPGKLIGGWQAGYVFQIQGGAPLGFGNALLIGDLHAIPLPADQRSLYGWFNKNVFNRDSKQQLAYNIRTLSTRFSGIRGPGTNNWDISGVKNTSFSERVRLQIRAEFINALNHPQFKDPNTSPTSGSFGYISGTSQWPRTIQFGAKVTF